MAFGLSNLLSTDSTRLGVARTAYGGKITPEINVNYAQKLFATTSGAPNMPKPQSMFRVFFRINSDYDMWREQKNELINFTTRAEMVNNLSESQEETGTFSKLLGVDENVKSATSTSASLKKWATSSKNVDIADLDTIIDSVANHVLSYELSQLVKSYTLPTITMETTTMNEYNRRRNLYLSGTKYGDLSLSFYDVKENPAQQFFFNYLKLINNDFFMKGNTNWDRRSAVNKWHVSESPSSKNLTSTNVSYDYNPFGYTTDTNNQLITTIYVCEYFCDIMVVYALKNPKIKTIDFGGASKDSMASKEIKVTFAIEGITNDMTDLASSLFNTDSGVLKKAAYYRSMVNAPITKEMAGFLNTRYLSETSFFSGVVNSILSTYISGEKNFGWSSLKENIKDTARMIGQAQSVNEAEKFQTTIRNYTKKNSHDRWQYLHSMSQDPTSVIGSSFFSS